MGIGYVNDYNSYLQNYKIPSIPSVSVEEVQKQDAEKKAQEIKPVEDARGTQQKEASNRQNASLENISITFNKQDSFDHIGKDSDINNLDMRKAISDMQKDQMLQQYQFFVGSMKNFGSDGTVIQK